MYIYIYTFYIYMYIYIMPLPKKALPCPGESRSTRHAAGASPRRPLSSAAPRTRIVLKRNFNTPPPVSRRCCRRTKHRFRRQARVIHGMGDVPKNTPEWQSPPRVLRVGISEQQPPGSLGAGVVTSLRLELWGFLRAPRSPKS